MSARGFLQDFRNIVSKIKHKLYIASGTAPPQTKKNSGCPYAWNHYQQEGITSYE
jgi:hypothetical protein